MNGRKLLKQIDNDLTEQSPYGSEKVHYRKKLEKEGDYLIVTAWRNHVLIHSSSDGNQDRIKEYCERYGVQWEKGKD